MLTYALCALVALLTVFAAFTARANAYHIRRMRYWEDAWHGASYRADVNGDNATRNAQALDSARAAIAGLERDLVRAQRAERNAHEVCAERATEIQELERELYVLRETRKANDILTRTLAEQDKLVDTLRALCAERADIIRAKDITIERAAARRLGLA